MIRQDETLPIVEKAIEKYKYLQEETVWIECYNGIIVINWHPSMDSYISTHRVMQIAKFLRKGTDRPIYSAIGKLDI